jgi:hypothetical protein
MMWSNGTQQKAVHRAHGELMHPQTAEPGNDVSLRGVLVRKECGGCLTLLGYLRKEGFA